MTVPGQPGPGEARRGRRTRTTESAISAGMAAGDDEAVLRAVAKSEIVVPQTPEAAAEGDGEVEKGSILLPVIEQDGTSYVPVFTSERTMNEAAPDIEDAVTVEAADLAANWPTGELWMAVNPGTEEAVTLAPEAVRSLPDFTEDDPATP